MPQNHHRSSNIRVEKRGKCQLEGHCDKKISEGIRKNLPGVDLLERAILAKKAVILALRKVKGGAFSHIMRSRLSEGRFLCRSASPLLGKGGEGTTKGWERRLHLIDGGAVGRNETP